MRRAALALLVVLSACAPKHWESGQASWYGPGLRGNRTASGDIFRPAHHTAAHRTLPFGTVLRVERPENGAHVRVVVNDRGPFVGDRVIDLSKGSARVLDMIDDGVADVRFRVVGCKRRYSGKLSCGAQ